MGLGNEVVFHVQSTLKGCKRLEGERDGEPARSHMPREHLRVQGDARTTIHET